MGRSRTRCGAAAMAAISAGVVAGRGSGAASGLSLRASNPSSQISQAKSTKPNQPASQPTQQAKSNQPTTQRNNQANNQNQLSRGHTHAGAAQRHLRPLPVSTQSGRRSGSRCRDCQWPPKLGLVSAAPPVTVTATGRGQVAAGAGSRRRRGHARCGAADPRTARARGCGGSAFSTLDTIEAATPDVLVLDHMLGDVVSGLELAIAVGALRPRISVLMFSAFLDTDAVYPGVSGVLSKARIGELGDRVVELAGS